jgi:membrane protein DedA with SNARE-associated domain
MNRNMIITAVVFLVAGAVTLGVLQFILHVQGAVLKLAIGVVVALIAGGIAFWVTREKKAQPQ